MLLLICLERTDRVDSNQRFNLSFLLVHDGGAADEDSSKFVIAGPLVRVGLIILLVTKGAQADQ